MKDRKVLAEDLSLADDPFVPGTIPGRRDPHAGAWGNGTQQSMDFLYRVCL